MATRSEELIAKILEQAKQLGKEGTTTVEGLDEAQLGKLSDALQAEIDTAAANEAAAKAQAKKGADKPKQYFVTEGNSLTSKRGIIAAGAEIFAEDVHGGLECLENFVTSGHLTNAAPK